jgi:hypothetical protein
MLLLQPLSQALKLGGFPYTVDPIEGKEQRLFHGLSIVGREDLGKITDHGRACRHFSR